ncbi:hypothetical protein ACTXT7_008096 [Hymenolepis weldensis]
MIERGERKGEGDWKDRRFTRLNGVRMNLTVEVFDADGGSADDEVGIFAHIFSPSSAYPKLKVKEMELLYGHDSTKMSLGIQSRCRPHHYGSECKYCRSTKGGYCDSKGTLVCFQGYNFSDPAKRE